jgi:hypothetical protein
VSYTIDASQLSNLPTQTLNGSGDLVRPPAIVPDARADREGRPLRARSNLSCAVRADTNRRSKTACKSDGRLDPHVIPQVDEAITVTLGLKRL